MIKPDLIEFKNKYLDVNISQGLQNNGRKNENKSSILESIQWILNDHLFFSLLWHQEKPDHDKSCILSPKIFYFKFSDKNYNDINLSVLLT